MAGLCTIPSGCSVSDGDGGAMISGTIKAFVGSGVVYMPVAKPQHPLARAVTAVLDLLVPSAQAAVAGVTVIVEGTGIEATTLEDGEFVLTSVPAGTQVLVFSFNGETARYQISVPENATITLEGVTIQGTSVSIDEVRIDGVAQPADEDEENASEDDDPEDDTPSADTDDDTEDDDDAVSPDDDESTFHGDYDDETSEPVCQWLL
jgi:hypothetical protein